MPPPGAVMYLGTQLVRLRGGGSVAGTSPRDFVRSPTAEPGPSARTWSASSWRRGTGFGPTAVPTKCRGAASRSAKVGKRLLKNGSAVEAGAAFLLGFCTGAKSGTSRSPMISRTRALKCGSLWWCPATKPWSLASSRLIGRPMRLENTTLSPVGLSELNPAPQLPVVGSPLPPPSKPNPPSPAKLPTSSLWLPLWALPLSPVGSPNPEPSHPPPPPILGLRLALADRELPCVAKSATLWLNPARKWRNSCGKPWPVGGSGWPARAFRTRCIAATKSGNVIPGRPLPESTRSRTLEHVCAPRPERWRNELISSRVAVSPPKEPTSRWKARAYFRQSRSDGTSRGPGVRDRLRLALAEREEPSDAKCETGRNVRRKVSKRSAAACGGMYSTVSGLLCVRRTRCIAMTNSGKSA
mmetsp:Transcript_106589/g.308415  ORF Transcript_106589/g.308415 Transcript_106589/m.308415 type:complete len:412 (-) Transcript_106589:692-1927(-)